MFQMPLEDLKQFYCDYQDTIVGYETTGSTPWNAPKNDAGSPLNWLDFCIYNWGVPGHNKDWAQSMIWGPFYLPGVGEWQDAHGYYQYLFGTLGGLDLFNATDPSTGKYRTVRSVVTSGPYGVPPIMRIEVSPNPVTGGSSATGTVTLCRRIPSGGSTAYVALSCDNPTVVGIPATVEVFAGNNAATFPVVVQTVTGQTTVNVSGSYGGVTMSTRLVVNP